MLQGLLGVSRCCSLPAALIFLALAACGPVSEDDPSVDSTEAALTSCGGAGQLKCKTYVNTRITSGTAPSRYCYAGNKASGTVCVTCGDAGKYLCDYDMNDAINEGYVAGGQSFKCRTNTKASSGVCINCGLAVSSGLQACDYDVNALINTGGSRLCFADSSYMTTTRISGSNTCSYCGHAGQTPCDYDVNSKTNVAPYRTCVTGTTPYSGICVYCGGSGQHTCGY